MEEAIPKKFQDGWVYKITELKEVLWQFNFMLNCAEWTADKNINMHKMTRLHRPWLITGHLVYHLWYGIENICYNGFRHFLPDCNAQYGPIWEGSTIYISNGLIPMVLRNQTIHIVGPRATWELVQGCLFKSVLSKWNVHSCVSVSCYCLLTNNPFNR